MTITLSSIYRFPLKSGAAQALDSALVMPRGIEFDRRWMVVDANNRFITGRGHSMLTQVKATPSEEALILSFPGAKELRVATPEADAVRREVTVWKSQCAAQDCGDAAAHWLTSRFGVECRLVYMDDLCLRTIHGEGADVGDEVSFADGFPLLLISQAALDALNERLSDPVAMLAFRPNLVVGGCAAHAEDDWKRVRVGRVEFDVVKACTRCVFTTVDPFSGQHREDGEPLNSLKTYRRSSNGILFGQNLIPRSSGTVYCGDTLTVLD